MLTCRTLSPAPGIFSPNFSEMLSSGWIRSVSLLHERPEHWPEKSCVGVDLKWITTSDCFFDSRLPAPFGNAHESRAARMRRAMEMLRSWCGQKAILGCGVPVMPAFGLVDYCRVSCDVGLDWDDVWYMRLFHRERVSTKQAINNTLFRRQLNGRAYGSDPDVFFLREENCKLTAEQKRTLATVNALLGNVFLTSDMPSHYTDAQRAEYRRLRTLFEHATQVQAEAENDRLSIRYLLDGTPQKLCFTPF